MLIGRIAAVLAIGTVMAAGGSYVRDLLSPAGVQPILQPPLPGPVLPYIESAARLTDADAAGSVAEVSRLAEQILRRAPLSAAPLVLLSDAKLKAGEPDVARSLAQAALQRDPRNPRLQIQLANDAARRGDLVEATERLATLMRVDPKEQTTYLAAMARIAGAPEGPQLVEAQLAAIPSWGTALVGLLIQRHPDLAFLGRLARKFPKAHESYLSRLVRERGVPAAHAEWRALLASDLRAKIGETPFNPTFQGGLAASPPFNWRIASQTAEIEGTHGLYASYDGRGRPMLVEQLLALPAGTYRLDVTGSATARSKGGGLAWTVGCQNARSVLLQLSFTDTAYATATFKGEFTVPSAGCDAQLLRLVGVPAEFTTGASTEVESVIISATSVASQQ